MKVRTITAALVLVSLLTLFSCSSLEGVKGKFSEPVKGKALSVIVYVITTGEVSVGINNTSNQAIAITPLKVRVIDEKGSDTETTFNLTRKSPDKIDFSGGSVIQGSMSVGNPNQSKPAQLGGSASLAPGESVQVSLGPLSKNMPERVQISIGAAGSNEQEVFAIGK